MASVIVKAMPTKYPSQRTASDRYQLRKQGLPYSGSRVPLLLLDKVVLSKRALTEARRAQDLRGIDLADKRLSQLYDEAITHLTVEERKSLSTQWVENAP